jgi:hypothetical protein
MLFYLRTAFLQVLEGEGHSVESLYSRVLVDKRHTQVMTISRKPIDERSFPNWTMDFATIDPIEAVEVLGDPGFFADVEQVRLDSRSANKLIAAFRRPKWKQVSTPLAAPIARRGK